MTTSERAFVTVDSFDGESLLKLVESPFGHWAALIVSSLTAGSLGAATVQLLSEKLLSLDVPDDEIRNIIGTARSIDIFDIIRTDVGAACINVAVREWNADLAGLNSDEQATDEPPEEVVKELNTAIIRSVFPL